MPEQALVCLAFVWGGWDVSVIGYLAVVAIPRPGEALGPKGAAFLPPSRFMLDLPTVYVKEWRGR